MILRFENFGWSWSEDGSYYGAKVYGEKDARGDVVIPRVVNGVAVKMIAYRAFEGNENITSVSIPQDMESIEDLAFARCCNLKTVTLPKMSGAIGRSVFADCRSLKNISLPEGVTEIGGCAFQNCASLEHIVIPKSVRKIDDFAFEDCASLKSIVFLGDAEVDRTILNRCHALESADLPKASFSKGLPFIDAPDTLKRVSVRAGGYYSTDWRHWLEHLIRTNPALRELILPADAKIDDDFMRRLPPACHLIRR